jgi:hypothetical protein
MSTTLLVDPPPVATAPPASRASWSGQLRLGSCCVPVKAYPTSSSTASVSLRQLHAGCGEHIEYHKCCPKHGRVHADQIVKGYPYSAEQCVALSEEDLATLEATDDKTIYLEHFLAPTEVDLTLLAGRSLYLAPAHPAALLGAGLRPRRNVRPKVSWIGSRRRQIGRPSVGPVVRSGDRPQQPAKPCCARTNGRSVGPSSPASINS